MTAPGSGPEHLNTRYWPGGMSTTCSGGATRDDSRLPQRPGAVSFRRLLGSVKTDVSLPGPDRNKGGIRCNPQCQIVAAIRLVADITRNLHAPRLELSIQRISIVDPM